MKPVEVLKRGFEALKAKLHFMKTEIENSNYSENFERE